MYKHSGWRVKETTHKETQRASGVMMYAEIQRNMENVRNDDVWRNHTQTQRASDVTVCAKITHKHREHQT